MTQNPISSGPRGTAAWATGGAARPAPDTTGIPDAPKATRPGMAMPLPETPTTAAAPPEEYHPVDPLEPAVPVPPDAYQVTEDIVISDNLVAVTKAGTVIDTKVDGTVISLADGTRVIVGKDGTVTLDPDFRNPGAVVDASTMHGPGTYISPNGTQVQIVDGKVVITNPDGEKLTVYANGSCKIDVPDAAPPVPPEVPQPVAPTPEPPSDNGGGSSGGSSGGSGSSSGSGSGSEPPSMPPIPTPTTPTPPSGGTPGGGTPGGGTPGGGTPGGGTPGGGTPGGGTPGGGTPGSGGHQPSTPPPAAGRDIKVTAGDLDRDAAYFSQQSANASAVAKSFTDVAGLIKEYGLWFGARAPYQKAAQQFATLYQGGSRQMTEISGALTKAGKAYRDNEDKGEELAEGIF